MAETPPPTGALADFVRLIGPFVPGIAGAVLGMMFAEGLTVRGKLLSLATGLACVMWLWPSAVLVTEHYLFGGGRMWPSLAATMAFLIGTFGMTVMSGLAQALAKYSRDPFGLVRIQAGPFTIGGRTDGGTA